MVLSTTASYTAADLPFRQNVHRQMELAIACILRAKEPERAERAQDSEYVNSENLFSSSSSVQRTEVEYASDNEIKQYRSHHHQSAPRQTKESLRCGRGAGTLQQ
jgi:hypothetical protein